MTGKYVLNNFLISGAAPKRKKFVNLNACHVELNALLPLNLLYHTQTLGRMLFI